MSWGQKGGAAREVCLSSLRATTTMITEEIHVSSVTGTGDEKKETNCGKTIAVISIQFEM